MRGGASTWRALAEEAAARFGTPCYVSRWRPVASQVAGLESRLTVPVRSWLSFKTHPLPRLAVEWARSGRGVEVTSEFELAAVTGAGCHPDGILVNGVAKQAWLPRWSTAGLRVHFDSPHEVQELAGIASRDAWRIGLRCHVPAERDRTQPRFGGQFGLTRAEVRAAAEGLTSAGVAVEGVHFHLGQGGHRPTAYGESIQYVVDTCLDAQLAPRYLDCGGGVDERDVDATVSVLNAAMDRARRALPSIDALWLENGRYMTQASAALVVRVLDVKERSDCRYLICDGGRTNQALDADNGAHPLLVVPPRPGPKVLTTVAGPTCMTDDRLGRLMLPATVRRGDLVVWLDAGAYHLPWETRFSRGLCAVAWADDADGLSLARAAESPEAWSQSCLA